VPVEIPAEQTPVGPMEWAGAASRAS